jgi:CDP-paratose 2-epimerase
MDQTTHLDGYTLVTGGAGFIGTNLVRRLLAAGEHVIVVDDFSRPGVERNARFLTALGKARLQIIRQDCRDRIAMTTLVRGASRVFHFAAQVAVTTSLDDPEHDFESNARTTLNVLEAVRRLNRRPPLLFTSTNKVYGALPDVRLKQCPTRYEPVDAEVKGGISEARSLAFCSPYGCSKGAADQYVLDYCKSFEVPTVVFRMSCIYGPHQCGNEDQGWVAHFLMRALGGQPITLYGDGLQVRDVLFVDDLIDAMLLAVSKASTLQGQAFNIGGGPMHTTSLLELVDRIALLLGERPELSFEASRVGDQRYYVSNVDRFRGATGWTPKTSLAEGLASLHSFLLRTGLDPAQRSEASRPGSGVGTHSPAEARR